ncbi:MAG TPA: SufE family protein [Pseudomonas sp.]|jgi:cysteine desulfuration protein SufE|nr:SufE family protein [Pseudomonas sp.]
MSLPASAQEALAAFAGCPGWEQRARLLMQWGERLEPLSEAQRVPANLVQGCESNVWLLAERREDRWRFTAYSDARLLRGLLAVLLARVDGLGGEELTQLDVADWFGQLGLSRQLSPSRSNGMNAVLQRMRELVA